MSEPTIPDGCIPKKKVRAFGIMIATAALFSGFIGGLYYMESTAYENAVTTVLATPPTAEGEPRCYVALIAEGDPGFSCYAEPIEP